MRHRFACVDHKRVNHLLDLPRIDLGFPKINRDVEVGAQTGAIEGDFSRLAKQIRDRGDPLEGRATFRKSEQLT